MRIFRSWLALIVVAMIALLSTGIADAHGGAIPTEGQVSLPYTSFTWIAYRDGVEHL